MIHTTAPFVSVIIPTYNRRELLKSSIESIFNQSYPKDRYEIIIVDNSSTDGTEDMIHSLQQTLPCLLRYYRKENEGPGSSRNMGIAKAEGTIIAFTDSDCVADQNWLMNGVARMDEGIGLVQGKTIPNPQLSQGGVEHSMKVMSEDGYYQTCNIFYRKECLDNVGGFSPEFCGLNLFGNQRGGEDTDLAWKVKKKGWKSTFADDAVVYHHVFQLSSLRSLFIYMRLNTMFANALNIKKHPELRDIILYRKVFKSKRRAFFYIFILSLFTAIFINGFFFLLGLPYVTMLLRVSFRGRPLRAYHRGFALFGLIIIIELIHSVLSLCTSLICRTVLL